MRVLVTGANGLLGANVVRELMQRKFTVRILARPAADLRALDGLKVERATGDILDTGSLETAIRGCDTVIHAAANTAQWPTHYAFYEKVNLTGTQNVIRICQKLDVKKVVYISTANTFGNGTRENPGTELSEFNAFRYNSGYIISKYVAQQWVLAEIERNRLPVVIVNPTFMIGPYDIKPGSGRIILMGLGKKVHLCPPGGKNFIHTRDAAIAVCNAIELGVPGECYLLANENLTYQEFFKKLDKVTGQKTVAVNIPAVLLTAAGITATLKERISGTGSPLNRVNARLLCLENFYSGSKAVEHLKMPQTPVEQAIHDAVQWFRNISSRAA